MSRWLITGATGSLGRHLVKQLVTRGHEVLSVGRAPKWTDYDGSSLEASNLTHLQADLLSGDFSWLQGLGCTHLIHTAWETAHPEYWTSPNNFFWQRASLELFDAFAQAGGQHFTFVTTCADDDHFPPTLYGASKFLVRQLLTERAHKVGIGFAALRMFFPYSAGENPNRITTLAVDHTLRGEPLHLRAGDVYRDIYPASAAAGVIVQASLRGAVGTSDLGTGVAVHLGRFLRDKVAGRLNREELISWDNYPAQGATSAGEPREIFAAADSTTKILTDTKQCLREVDQLVQSRQFVAPQKFPVEYS